MASCAKQTSLRPPGLPAPTPGPGLSAAQLDQRVTHLAAHALATTSKKSPHQSRPAVSTQRFSALCHVRVHPSREDRRGSGQTAALAASGQRRPPGSANDGPPTACVGACGDSSPPYHHLRRLRARLPRPPGCRLPRLGPASRRPSWTTAWRTWSPTHWQPPPKSPHQSRPAISSASARCTTPAGTPLPRPL